MRSATTNQKNNQQDQPYDSSEIFGLNSRKLSIFLSSISKKSFRRFLLLTLFLLEAMRSRYESMMMRKIYGE